MDDSVSDVHRHIFIRSYASSKCSWSSHKSRTFLGRQLVIATKLYQKDLFGHFGCINAIEFSREGQYLVSGGDDRRVLLWNIAASAVPGFVPHVMKAEHDSNIFCLAIDSAKRRVFSGGNDEQVIVHDLNTGEALDVYNHNETLYGLSVDPSNDDVFAVAGESGQVLIYDTRSPPSCDPECVAVSSDAFHSVQFHPIEPIFLLTANSREGIALWDRRHRKEPVLRYGEKRTSQPAMSAKFNENGTQILALRRRLPPVLHNTSDSKAICQFDSDCYYNSCTMKSCCFAGDREQFVLSGSDDFNLYMWKVPEENSGVRYRTKAHLVLKGHRSIVNQVRFNCHNFVIASSGVEKIIKLWSTVNISNEDDASPEKPLLRKLYKPEDYLGMVLESGEDVNHDYTLEKTSEDTQMMAFFDSLIQREVGGSTSNSDASSDSDCRENEKTATRSIETSSSSDTDDESIESHKPLRLSSLLHSVQCESSPAESSESVDSVDVISQLIAKKRARIRTVRKNARKERRSLPGENKRLRNVRLFLNSVDSNRRVQFTYRPSSHEDGVASGSSDSPSVSLSDESIVLKRRGSLLAPYTTLSVYDTDSDTQDCDVAEGQKLTQVRPESELIFGSHCFSQVTSGDSQHTTYQKSNFESKENSNHELSPDVSPDESCHYSVKEIREGNNGKQISLQLLDDVINNSGSVPTASDNSSIRVPITGLFTNGDGCVVFEMPIVAEIEQNHSLLTDETL